MVWPQKIAFLTPTYHNLSIWHAFFEVSWSDFFYPQQSHFLYPTFSKSVSLKISEKHQRKEHRNLVFLTTVSQLLPAPYFSRNQKACERGKFAKKFSPISLIDRCLALRTGHHWWFSAETPLPLLDCAVIKIINAGHVWGGLCILSNDSNEFLALFGTFGM